LHCFEKVWLPCRLDDLETALEVAKIVLPTYEKLLDMPYPLSKMDLVAIPDFQAGAMENWGLLLFQEVTLVASKQDSSIDTLRDVTLTIAHEMAHMVSLALSTWLPLEEVPGCTMGDC
jgi:aminopeptidase N